MVIQFISYYTIESEYATEPGNCVRIMNDTNIWVPNDSLNYLLIPVSGNCVPYNLDRVYNSIGNVIIINNLVLTNITGYKCKPKLTLLIIGLKEMEMLM